jgi:clan AA aspartic protease (TIGR02281 family)
MIAPKETLSLLWLTLCALVICAWPLDLHAQTTVQMSRDGGVYTMPCKVNGLALRFIIDTGASNVMISAVEALFMQKNGYLKKNDFMGEETYRIASGATMTGSAVIFRRLEIGDIVLRNVKASVAHPVGAPLLLGQSALRQLGTVAFNYANNTVTFGGNSSTSVAEGISPRAVSQPASDTMPRAVSRPSGNSVPTTPAKPPKIEMVFVKGGTFTMGCVPERDGGDCLASEEPAHQVTVSDFYIGKYEVTQAEWRAVMGNSPSYFLGDRRPVEWVSWNDVQEFISRLNAKTGKNYRLPTEAEWEYAARGGANSRGYRYSGGNDLDAVVWYFANSGNQTQPVGMKAANELGLYDMNGNVWEWCQDWYGPYGNEPVSNPTGPGQGERRVSRGGGWNSFDRSCRASYRNDWWGLDGRLGVLGFRLVSR